MAGFFKTPIFILAAAISPVWSSFSLNVSGPDWDYTVKDLANTTSEACQIAYSAQIDCDETLLGYVASMRPAFDPTSDDLDRTCTTTCSDSLASYITSVIEACDQPGDRANQEVTSNTVAADDPVALVGQILQYTFVQKCRQNATGYCTLQGDIGNADDFTCDDECTLQFYTNAHNYGASGWLFNYYYLVDQSSCFPAWCRFNLQQYRRSNCDGICLVCDKHSRISPNILINGKDGLDTDFHWQERIRFSEHTCSDCCDE